MRVFRIFETSANPFANFFVRSAYVIAETRGKAIKAAKDNRVQNWSRHVRQDANEYNDGAEFKEFEIKETHKLNSEYFRKTMEPWMKSPEKPLDK